MSIEYIMTLYMTILFCKYRGICVYINMRRVLWGCAIYWQLKCIGWKTCKIHTGGGNGAWVVDTTPS